MIDRPTNAAIAPPARAASERARGAAADALERDGFARLPRHVGFIPDGNRRWAEGRGRARAAGYAAGIDPGIALLDACARLGIDEVSIYGFTKENVRRPRAQVAAFRDACVAFARRAVDAGAALLVVGDAGTPSFPDALRVYTRRAAGRLRVNLVVNYTWDWDLGVALSRPKVARAPRSRTASAGLGSSDVSRIDLVVRWGGRRRLSGFLPVQCAYADLYVADALWPDMRLSHFADALRWYERQDVTLGG